MSEGFALRSAAPSWAAWLAEFERELYPVFAAHGVPLAEALVTYELNTIYNRLARLRREEDDGEDWKRGNEDDEGED